ncbi:host specificity factor TipJ family phage tail protein [Paraburkholderia nemoris]|uniref:host specificity factor TipJ family phage tail protein n=1 Tax=Paraburkholderia nemoris TaxID=2793076 RepID=UPI0038B9971C
MSGLVVSAPNKIPVIRIVNPFDPRQHVREEIDWVADKPLSEYFPAGSVEHVVSINGKVVEPKNMPVTYLAPTDNIVLCPIPEGGSGGKGILRIVGMIAVAVASVWTGGAAAAAYASAEGVAATSLSALTVGAFASMAVSIAGSLLINALLPAPKPPQQAASSPTYGIDGAKNTADEGTPIPLCYGQFRMAGNVIDMYVENGATDPNGYATQILHMLIAAGEGPIAGISDVEFDFNDYTLYQQVQVWTLPGNAQQQPLPGFSQNIAPFNFDENLTTDWVYYTTNGPIDAFRVDLAAPSGLYSVDPNSGSSSAVTVGLQVQFAPLGTQNWQDIQPNSTVQEMQWIWATESPPANYVYYDSDTGMYVQNYGYDNYIEVPPTYNWYYSDANGDVNNGPLNATDLAAANNGWPQDMGNGRARMQIPTQVAALQISDNNRSTVRTSLSSQQVPNGMYQIRMRRTSPVQALSNQYIMDIVEVTDVNEITYGEVGYNNTALVAVQVLLTNQLTSIPNVTYINQGKLIWGYVDVSWSDEPQWIYSNWNNPAWIIWDMLTNTRYGGGMDSSRLDLPAFKQWADFCDEQGLTFNGVIDQQTTLWDAMQGVLRVGHAQLVNSGTRYTIAIEGPADPVMMFSVANIVEGSFQEQWSSITDRANEIEVIYYDQTDHYKEHRVRVYDPAAIAAGRPSKTSSIAMPGIVDYQRAYDEALFQLNLNRYVTATIKFSAPMEAVACSVGDVILMQHDMPDWGTGGRFNAGSSTTVVNLDRPVDMTPGLQYQIMVIYDSIFRYSGTVVGMSGSILWLSNFDGANRVRRIWSFNNGQLVGDFEVTGTQYNGSGLWGVTVDATYAFQPGYSYELYDTDAMVTVGVVNNGQTGNTSLQLQSPLPIAPVQYQNWMFGSVGQYGKPFRITSIGGSSEYTRDLQAIEYNPSIYDLSGGSAAPEPDFSALAPGVNAATISGVVEELFQTGNGYRSHVTVTFSSSQQTYVNSSVYAAVNGKPWVLITDNASDRATIDLNQGDKVTFLVQAQDAVGDKCVWGICPQISYTVLGQLLPPAQVAGATLTVRVSDILLQWNANTEVDLKGYEIREGANWDDGVVLVKNYQGTSFAVTETTAGQKQYWLKAINTANIYSTTATELAVTLNAPVAVSGFDVNQSLGNLVFVWDKNPESNIEYYEIRQGATWGTGVLVTQVKATTYTMPASYAGSLAPTFWITAVASPGVYGATPVFSTAQVAIPSNTNVVYTDDAAANNFPDTIFGFTSEDGELVMSPGVTQAEYTMNVDLGDTFTANNSVSLSLNAAIESGLTWDTANFTWDSTEAAQSWLPSGDLTNMTAFPQIAVFQGVQPDDVDGFSLNGTLEGLQGDMPVQSLGGSYAQGRFGQGLAVSDTTFVKWNVSVPAVFSQSFWVAPQEITDCIFQTLSGAPDVILRVGYSAQQGAFYLEDGLAQRIYVPFPLTVGLQYLVAVNQGNENRSLFVASMDGTQVETATANYPAQGPFTTVALY